MTKKNKKDSKEKSTNLIHVKLNYDEAVRSKVDILGTQKNLLEVMKALKRYHMIRIQEMKLKELLYKTLKSLKLNINRLNKSMPAIKIPKIIEHEHKENIKTTSKKIKEIAGRNLQNSDLEKELFEIQKKLQELS